VLASPSVVATFYLSPCLRTQPERPNDLPCSTASALSSARPKTSVPTLNPPLLQCWDDVVQCPISALPPCFQYGSNLLSNNRHETCRKGSCKPPLLSSALEQKHAQSSAHPVTRSFCSTSENGKRQRPSADRATCRANAGEVMGYRGAHRRAPLPLPQAPAGRALMKQQHPKRSNLANVKLQRLRGAKE
jgi:hypothetical protein